MSADGDLFGDLEQHYRLLAGVDEAGRGPLAGDVVAAAVILDPERPIDGLADSKVLTAERREDLYELIVAQALAWSVGRASVAEIDTMNILNASMLAMERAVEALAEAPEFILVDGNRCPGWRHRSASVVGGDGTVAAISAASIVAKVTRDREMCELDGRFPGYGFASHKGYGTPAHLEALRRLGACDIHRRSYAPVRELLDDDPGARPLPGGAALL